MEFCFLICSERSGSNLITRLRDGHSPTRLFRILEALMGVAAVRDRSGRSGRRLGIGAGWTLGGLLVIATSLMPGCRPEAAPAAKRAHRPAVVFAIDGAEWSVIRELWEDGRLRSLQGIARAGVVGELETLMPSKSPVVWTTVATGREPRDHGIVDFVVPTERGDVPVSTASRKVPALWNMASASGLRVAVLGWWPSWPAEEINGVVVSNRILHGALAQRFWPPAFEKELERMTDESRRSPSPFPPNPQAELDHLLSCLARELADGGFDLLMVYLRSVDVTSHRYWKYFRPRSDQVTAAARHEFGGVIPAAYEAVDATIAAVLERARPETNVFVVSDHGFAALAQEKTRISFDLDRLLIHLGFLSHRGGAVDTDRSTMVTFASNRQDRAKKVRFVGVHSGKERTRLREELERRLATVRYATGAGALTVRDADRQEEAAGADFIVEVSSEEVSRTLLAGTEPLEGVVTQLVSVSGGHPEHHPGIFIAAGPDIDPDARLRPIRVHDITPTLLYALGLPVAKDFAGRAITELFSDEFRATRPLRSIASWGGDRREEVRPSEVDEELVEALRNLGYLTE